MIKTPKIKKQSVFFFYLSSGLCSAVRIYILKNGELLLAFFVILTHKKSGMRLVLKIVLLFSVMNSFSQEVAPVLPIEKIDSLYREDQFYFGFTLNTLQNKPSGLTQNKFSPGFSAGFLRDIPLNKSRTVAIAPGIGFSYNSFNQNIAITEPNQSPIYSIIDSQTAYSKNRFENFLVEIPIELRWRTSTYEGHKFWRIYGGFKLGYLIFDRSLYQDDSGKIVVSRNNDFNKFQYGATLSAGYNTINVYAYYGLNSLFQSGKIGNESLNMNSMNIGIIFYIL